MRKLPEIFICIILPVFLFVHTPFYAQQTEKIYLSGTGPVNAVDWEFYCTAGRNAGKWDKIPVPSNWELHGYGTYNYGNAKNDDRGKESGMYKYEFRVPSGWSEKIVHIIFEGSMTDTEVKVNGKLAGTVHQGAFYRFDYDISKLLKFGSVNNLEVKVSKHSSNESVNRAERYGDYWIFGGIFRPVYLEAYPESYIERVAIDARANGDLQANAYLVNAPETAGISAYITDLDGRPVGDVIKGKVNKNQQVVHLKSTIHGIKPWNQEDPNLYFLTFRLEINGKTVHEISERIGFRTIEVRERDGIYLNGVKLKLKGVNRHSFRPGTGRALSKANSIEDVMLMKKMNMNAVRMSHYPPDTHFLDVCDSLGLLVLDELAGWHDAYDTEIGTKLVTAMVKRDVNHPSVIIWDNGNEGGSNPDLDNVFKKYDLQKRAVIHPWYIHEGITTEHYRDYNYGTGTFWHGPFIVLPTEFLHGLYDGGLGAGLCDYWDLILDFPRAAGGFLWNFADEGVIRTDRQGYIDTHGASASDGILGPFHEKEASFFAIKEIWSPVQIKDKIITPSFDQHLNIENRFLFTNLNKCEFTWKLRKLSLSGDSCGEHISGKVKGPDIEPGQSGNLTLDLPEAWLEYDVLYFSGYDPSGKEIYTWSFPVKRPREIAEEIFVMDGQSDIALNEIDQELSITVSDLEFIIGRKDGKLKKVSNRYGEIPFNNGPVLSAGITEFKHLDIRSCDDSLELVCSYAEESRLKELIWTVYPSGLLKLSVVYMPPEYDTHFDYMGLDFSFPEDQVEAVRWMGNGPYRVWKNRLAGVEMDVHYKPYNRTITGYSQDLVYPEFKGYHSEFYWAEIYSSGQNFTVGTASEDVYLRLFTPDQPEDEYFEETAPPFPGGDISFMQGIPPIGTKGMKPERLGPSGRKNMYFDYGPYDHWRKRGVNLVLFFDFTTGK